VFSLKAGTVIKFDKPLSFSNGLELDTFTVQDIKKGYLRSAYGTVKIRRSTFISGGWEIVAAKIPA